MDVTGLVGFAKDFGTTESFDDEATDETFEVLKAGASLDIEKEALTIAWLWHVPVLRRHIPAAYCCEHI